MTQPTPLPTPFSAERELLSYAAEVLDVLGKNPEMHDPRFAILCLDQCMAMNNALATIGRIPDGVASPQALSVLTNLPTATRFPNYAAISVVLTLARGSIGGRMAVDMERQQKTPQTVAPN